MTTKQNQWPLRQLTRIDGCHHCGITPEPGALALKIRPAIVATRLGAGAAEPRPYRGTRSSARVRAERNRALCGAMGSRSDVSLGRDRKMAEIGLLGMTAPAKFGGSEASAVSLAIAVEEIARADASCALVLSMANSLSILCLMQYGTPQQQAEWLPRIVAGECIACFTLTEPQAGSNAAAIKATAMRRGDRYVLRGSKQFISLGSVSRLAFVFAMTEPGAGTKGISCFLVPTDSEGFSVVRKEDKLGLRASDTCQFAFDDIEIAGTQMLGKPGSRLSHCVARARREPHRCCSPGYRRRGGG